MVQNFSLDLFVCTVFIGGKLKTQHTQELSSATDSCKQITILGWSVMNKEKPGANASRDDPDHKALVFFTRLRTNESLQIPEHPSSDMHSLNGRYQNLTSEISS